MSYWPAVVDRLHTIFSAVAPEGTRVSKYVRESDSGRDYLVVGWDDEVEVGVVDFDLSAIGNQTVSETGSVRTAVVCQSGNRSPAASSERAFALVTTLVQALAEDQTLGGLLPISSTVTCQATVQNPIGQQGVARRLDLIVTYSTP